MSNRQPTQYIVGPLSEVRDGKMVATDRYSAVVPWWQRTEIKTIGTADEVKAACAAQAGEPLIWLVMDNPGPTMWLGEPERGWVERAPPGQRRGIIYPNAEDKP